MKLEERLEAMAQVMRHMVHDVNNALAPITLSADALLEGEPSLSDRGKRFAKSIQGATGAVERMFDRLRSFYRDAGEDELAMVDLCPVLRQVADLAGPLRAASPATAAAPIRTRLAAMGALPPVAANEGEVRDALINLLQNSMEAMPRGGTILVSGVTEGSDLVLSVRDDGLGMNGEQLAHCVEPFATTKGKPGTGLGLAMVHGVMRRHGGRLEIESAPGKGTTVRLRFPLQRGQASATGSTGSAPRS